MRAALRARLAAAVACLAAAAAAEACPRTSVTAMEGRVMCQVCGTTLALARDAPEARRERALIGRLVRRCASEQQIEQALVAQFGDSVLALPPRRGFSLSAYLVPAVGLAVAIAALAAAGLRTRRRGAPRLAPAAPPSGEDARRVAAELERFGR